MTTVRLAGRAACEGGLNAIARARSALVAADVDLLDLSDSNPTRHGLLHPGVLRAVADHAGEAARYEPHPRGLATAREALAVRYGGDPGDYWLTESTSQAYSWLLTLLADPGDQIAVPEPGYPLVEPLARFAGVRTIGYRWDYLHPDGWMLDAATLSQAVSGPATRAVVVVNPGNPTGSYLGGALDVVVASCTAGDAALVSDEVFLPFVLDGPVDSSLDGLVDGSPDGDGMTVAGEERVPTFVLGGLSKLLCAPQVKLGWIRLSGPGGECAPLRDGLDAIADAFLPVSGPVAAALPDLLALADGSVGATRRRLATNLAAARAELADGPFRVRRCDGGWTVIVDVPRNLPVPDLAVHLLEHVHLAVHPGWLYDLPADGALALSLLPEPDRFAEGVRRLRGAVEELAG